MEDALYPLESKGHLCEHLEMSQELQKNMLECYGLVPFEMLVVSVAFALAIGLERRIKPEVVIPSSTHHLNGSAFLSIFSGIYFLASSICDLHLLLLIYALPGYVRIKTLHVIKVIWDLLQ